MTSMKQRALIALQHERQKERLRMLGPEFFKRNRLMQAYGRKSLNPRWYGRQTIRF